MIVSHKKKFIFLAFNKTGSSSVEKALKEYRNPFLHIYLQYKYRRLPAENKYLFKHAAPKHIKLLLGADVWDAYTSFVFVRNPYDRFVSLFHYRNKRESLGYPLNSDGFQAWLESGQTKSMHKLVSDFICDDDGKVIVDIVGRFENLVTDFNRISDQIGISKKLPHINKTKHAKYRDYYNDETRALVRSIALRDIEMFDYEF